MIIPVKCFTCGKVLANLYRWYKREVRRLRLQEEEKTQGGEHEHFEENPVKYLTPVNKEKTHDGKVLDQLNVHNICCRRHMLTHVDIE